MILHVYMGLLVVLQKVTKTCGETTWKAAAATQGKAFTKKTVTGCMLATCRHSLVLKGLDMHRGEIYAYPYTLQVTNLTALTPILRSLGCNV